MSEKTSISNLCTADNSPFFTFESSYFTFDQRCYEKVTPSIPDISFLKCRSNSERSAKDDVIPTAVTSLTLKSEEETMTIFIPNTREKSDSEILSSGKPISLSTLKNLRKFSEFNSEENLTRFLELFFFGKKGDFELVDLNEKETLLLKRVLLQRIPSKHNRWLVNMVNNINKDNYKKIMKTVEGHVTLHRNNICEHFIFCKVISFSRGKSNYKFLSSFEFPVNKLLTTDFLKTTFSVSEIKTEFRNVFNSESFREILVESSRKNFRVAAKGLLFAAELSLEKPELNVCPKVNLGVTAIQVDNINFFFRKYLV